MAYIEKINPTLKVGIVLVHGLAEHKGRYEYFYDEICKLNFSVFAIDIRGHGESDKNNGYVKNFQTLLSDLDLFIKLLKEKYPEMKIALLGHSLGGLIASSYVSKYKTIDFLMLSNPLLKYKKLKVLFSIIPYRMLGFIKIKKRHSESKEMLQYSYNDPLSTNRLSLRMLGVIFKEGLSFISKNIQNIKIPTLLMLGGKDPVLNNKNYKQTLDKFATDSKNIIIYPNVKHRLLQSDEKDRVISDMANWINNYIGEKNDSTISNYWRIKWMVG